MKYLNQLIKKIHIKYLKCDGYFMFWKEINGFQKLDNIDIRLFLLFEKINKDSFCISLFIRWNYNPMIILYDNKKPIFLKYKKRTFYKKCVKHIIFNLKLLNKLKFSKFFNIFSLKNEDAIVEEEMELLKQNINGFTYENVCVICYSYCNNRLQCCKTILCIACNNKIEKCPICRTFFDHNGIIDLNDDDSTDSLDYQEINRQIDLNNAEIYDDNITIDSLSIY